MCVCIGTQVPRTYTPLYSSTCPLESCNCFSRVTLFNDASVSKNLDLVESWCIYNRTSCSGSLPTGRNCNCTVCDLEGGGCTLRGCSTGKHIYFILLIVYGMVVQCRSHNNNSIFIGPPRDVFSRGAHYLHEK